MKELFDSNKLYKSLVAFVGGVSVIYSESFFIVTAR